MSASVVGVAHKDELYQLTSASIFLPESFLTN